MTLAEQFYLVAILTAFFCIGYLSFKLAMDMAREDL